MAHIRVITPVYFPEACNMESLKPYEKTDLQISLTYGEIDAQSVRHEFDLSLVAPAVIKRVLEADKEQVDAIVVNFSGEIGLEACREAASVPIVSLAETAVHVAGTLGRKFSIINTTSSATSLQRALVNKYGFASRLASIREVEIHPTDDYYSKDNIAFLANQCINVIKEDHAEVIFLGSGRLFNVREALSVELQKQGYDIPLIEPLPTAIYYAKFLVDAKLCHSKYVFPFPTKEALISYKHLIQVR